MISARREVLVLARRSLLQHQRLKSSSAYIPVPESLRDAVKSSILDEATKADSSFWSNKSSVGLGAVNGHQHYDHNSHYPNGVNGGMNGVNGSSSIQHATTIGLDDPLDEWHLDSTPKYWPDIPDGVVSTADPFVLSKDEIDSLDQSIREDLLGTDHPVLNQAASYFFQSDNSGGKKVRPTMVVLLSRALADHAGAESAESSLWSTPTSWQRSDLPQAQRRLAEISELIHTASLFHDDVIDEAETRRGKAAVHQVFGNKMAILAGDYLLARASISLARLRQVDVVETMSTIIEHLVRGEVMQMKGTSSTESRLTYYLRKNYFKTGSLMANSCRSTALLGNYSAELVDCSYRYGKHIGMAFQLVDDVLDYEGSAKTMGKPALSDLNAGLATAPVLYALQSQTHDTLQTMMDRKFREEGDIDRTVDLVFASNGIKKTQELAQVHAELAMEAVLELKPSKYRDALVHLAYKVVDRTR